MRADKHSGVRPERASTDGRKQRDGTGFIGGMGMKNGESDLLFVKGQLPEDGDRIASDESPARQLKRCLNSLESQVRRHGATMEDVLKVTLYLADMDAYEPVNEAYEAGWEASYPARTTVGVCELLGGAAVTIDAVVAIE